MSGFKIKSKPLDLFQNQSKWDREKRKQTSFRNGYLTFVVVIGIFSFMCHKGLIKGSKMDKQNKEQYGNNK